MNSESDRLFFSALGQAQAWAAECRDLGWLLPRDVERFSVDRRSPAALFPNSGQRPLIVAFFGGTGVGKSTLLNRLAEHEVARTGVMRPTSREVSLYIHCAVDLERLPEKFPIEKVRIDRHAVDKMKNILWIDMPDIDSTETANREIVLEWLPHIDVLVYVVSPERYRDEKGWQLLLSKGARYAWLFAMNQIDQGDPSQRDDFIKQLLNAGFKNPIVFATDCSGTESAGRDEFRQLQETIENLANRHTIEHLEFRSLVAHMHEIENNIDLCMDAMGSPSAIDLMVNRWESVWNDAVNDLNDGIQWPIHEAARIIGSAGGEKNLIKQLAKEGRKEHQAQSQSSTNPMLWDDWAQTRFDDALDQLAVTAGANGIPVTPIKSKLAEIRTQARKILHSQTEQSLRRTLANPGNSIQRQLLAITRLCSGLFPLTAIIWVAYEVLDQFHTSSVSGAPYLGVNFAIHSGLLIFVSWLLPWFIYRKLTPSTEEVALQALQNGTRVGYECIKSRIDDMLRNLVDERVRLIAAAEKITAECSRHSFSETKIENQTLDRMLSKQATIQC